MYLSNILCFGRHYLQKYKYRIILFKLMSSSSSVLGASYVMSCKFLFWLGVLTSAFPKLAVMCWYMNIEKAMNLCLSLSVTIVTNKYITKLFIGGLSTSSSRFTMSGCAEELPLYCWYFLEFRSLHEIII